MQMGPRQSVLHPGWVHGWSIAVNASRIDPLLPILGWYQARRLTVVTARRFPRGAFVKPCGKRGPPLGRTSGHNATLPMRTPSTTSG
jgi:hypothetical protein